MLFMACYWVALNMGRPSRLAQTFQHKGRAGTLAQQALQAIALVRLDAYLGVDRKAAAVIACALSPPAT